MIHSVTRAPSWANPPANDEQRSDRRKRAEVDERLTCRRIAPRLGALHASTNSCTAM